MTFTTLGALIEEIGDHDEYSAIFVAPARPFGPASRCFIVLGDHPV